MRKKTLCVLWVEINDFNIFQSFASLKKFFYPGNCTCGGIVGHVAMSSFHCSHSFQKGCETFVPFQIATPLDSFGIGHHDVMSLFSIQINDVGNPHHELYAKSFVGFAFVLWSYPNEKIDLITLTVFHQKTQFSTTINGFPNDFCNHCEFIF